jgi:hypothetical protein
MSKDTCVHYQDPGHCRARSPTCAHHDNGVCRAAGKLEERAIALNYGFRFWRCSPERLARK